MKTDILQILHEEATTQYNPNGKDERVVNSDEFDTVANQIVNLFKDKKYTEEDMYWVINMSIGLRDSGKTYSDIDNEFQKFKQRRLI